MTQTATYCEAHCECPQERSAQRLAAAQQMACRQRSGNTDVTPGGAEVNNATKVKGQRVVT